MAVVVMITLMEAMETISYLVDRVKTSYLAGTGTIFLMEAIKTIASS